MMHCIFRSSTPSTVQGLSRRYSVTATRFQSAAASLSRYGLGGHHWKRFNPESYQELIRQALSRPIPVSYFEVAGQEGGDIAMVGAMQSAMERLPHLADLPITITTRIGYRTIDSGDATQQNIPGPHDVVLTEEDGKSTNVVHNLSSEYLEETLQSSPLLELQHDFKHLRLVYLLQNPEAQVLELLKNHPTATPTERQAFIQERWLPALTTLQQFSTRTQQELPEGEISFGVVSNGLGIPAENNHPLQLDPQIVMDAAQSHDKFLTVQLPANLLETHGWDVARRLRQAVPHITIATMRPLTCYPDLGTGSSHPFRLVDYSLPTLDGKNPFAPMGDFPDDISNKKNNSNSTSSLQYTHEMSGIPAIYQIALQTAMSHFDADALLEIKQERDLTMEERETLDGCKLVQSMIHDLDSDLDHVRSFAAHEEELYGRIIPLLYDTFEAMDDDTSDVLQAYFAAYAVAVRYSIAKKTRQIVQQGEKGNGSMGSSSSPTYPDIPATMSLQEYSLRHLMAEPSFDRIVIGASTMQDFRHQVELMEKISMDPAPLDAIAKPNQ